MKEDLEGAKGDSGQGMEEKSQRSKTGRPTAKPRQIANCYIHRSRDFLPPDIGC